ncbi:L-lactate permease [Clostridium saccharobutylicum]|uniref:L-lactate permease n=1 Tax=Clostridium saccharobutylicum DSM 13864 TaxID=1345695 RepID=U5MTD9_CLOSA|nr:L-lactate permease [Clostridium saccharobutylicum]AGX42891.1 L-lactate permease LctP [Clostridium saccharobutylicum DSM 13864]AQR90185.1 glycolate permease GlcA [Clostridium saccharobutylicum]AQS00091.1 glycolate permease GlcA [Clostridium saccharobutylicum]AQS09878.1 glycolate permease GlcA [Clostridium saccharobutylicum]AQS14074.1 glycolate permease GlcA [Clostridium saccharobutylicum]
MLFLKFLMAILPILWLIIALSGLKMSGYKACSIALILTMVLAIFFWKLNVVYTVTGILEGILNALWPICLVIIAALFTYNLILRTGAMDSIKKMLAGVSSDKRVLILIIGWGFGSFMEGMAGFGTAVAIPASMLAGVGLNPFAAVLACLVANTTPTAFGSVGIPIVTLSAVTGIGANTLAVNTVIIEGILCFISPFIMVCIIGGGIKALKGAFAVTLISALSFTVPAYITAMVLGGELPDIVGSICCMICTIIGAKIFNKKPQPEYCIEVKHKQEETLSFGKAVQAWCPFILIFFMLMFTSTLCPPIHNLISGFKTSVCVYAGQGGNILTFSWINTPGIIIFVAAIIGGLIQGAKISLMFDVLLDTLKANWKTIVTICAVMSTAKVMSYSGMISDIASLLVVVTGGAYPLISPLIGAIGAFVTGSGTSTSVLFGGLQVQTAEKLGLSGAWMAAANVFGAGIGKMICPQSIAIGASAINKSGSESKILRSAFKYFVCYVVIAGIICFLGTL